MESFTKFAALEGAAVLVTGGATGIGSAIVETFVRQGSRVIFLDLDLDGQCLKRFIEPEEVAIMVAFLASEGAKSCTNQTFIIDAGWD